MMGGCFRRHAEGGFALLAVFWLVLLLAIMALGYASSTRLRARIALNQLQIIQNRYDDAAAMAVGYQAYTTFVANRALFSRRQPDEASAAEQLGLWHPRFEPYEATAVAAAQVQIRYAGGRFDVNHISAATFDAVLTCCGVVRASERNAIINSVLDWCDADNAHHAEGAENDYYNHLDPEYNCKNAPIEVLEELLLVKGITPQLYYGNLDWASGSAGTVADAGGTLPYYFDRDNQHPGLVHFLSVYGSARLDVNSAAPQTLLLVDDISPEQIAAIVALRSERAIHSLTDLSAILDSDQFAVLRRYFTVMTVPHYLVVATAVRGTSLSPLLWRRRVFDLNTKRDKDL